MKRILDQLDAIEGAAGLGLAGRVDRSKVAVVGHSMGGHTASVLLGARHENESVVEPRIKAGVLLAAARSRRVQRRSGARRHAEPIALVGGSLGGLDSCSVAQLDDKVHIAARGPRGAGLPRFAAGTASLVDAGMRRMPSSTTPSTRSASSTSEVTRHDARSVLLLR